MNNMISSIIAENIRRHVTQENNKQGFQQGLVLYP